MNPSAPLATGTAPTDHGLAGQAAPGQGVPLQDPAPAAQRRLEPRHAAREGKSVPMGGSLVAPAAAVPESPPVAAAEARAAAPLRVSGVGAMARSRLLTVAVDALLVEVAALLSGEQISVVVVCDATGAAVGVVTETMLVRRLGLGQADFFSTRAGDVMTPEFTACAPEDRLSEVLAMMHARGLIHVLLLDAERHPIGVLNARDGLRALLAVGNHEEALLRNYVMGVGYR